MQTLLNLLASVALLIWGTHIVRTGMLRVLGADLRRVLSGSVANRFSAFAAGLGVTGLVQSSSATALITSSFVARNLIPLAPALAIMLGADVGTSIMAQVFSLDLSWLSPLLIFFGVVFFLSRKTTRAGQIGRVAIGLGLIILALQLIMAATQPIVQAQGVKVLFASVSGDILLDMLLGALFVVLSWSSLAIVLLTAALAAAGVIAVPVALCFVLGANLGSGLLVLLATSATNPVGRRVALGNLMFKIIGCVIFATALPWLLPLLASFQPEAQRQVVNFHVLFNVSLAVIFIFFTEIIARWCVKLFPDNSVADVQAAPRHLDEAALPTPALAIANAAREALRIGDLIEQMLNGMLNVLKTNNEAVVEEVRRLDDDVDKLYSAVKFYLTQISREALDDKDGRRWTEIISLTINLEQVGDIIERIVEDLQEKKIALNRSFSEAGTTELCDLHARLVGNLKLGLNVFINGDVKSAQMLLAEKERFRDLERAYASTHLDRLSGQSVQSIETSSLHLDVISDMKRINSHLCSIAYPILEQAGKLRSSRLKGNEKRVVAGTSAAQAAAAAAANLAGKHS
ncbi:MAG: Na/Pi cotransporter family protein [Betaproteobacteria bacterium]